MSRYSTSASMACFFLAMLLYGCSSSTDLTQYEVVSSSMAPNLSGPTRQAECRNCTFRFPVAAETYRETLPTRCGRCGGLCSVSTQILRGERVEVLPLRDPHELQRFDLLVFRESGIAQVKRLWGMPDEEVAFEAGDLWIDRRPFQKNLAELKQICVPVDSLAWLPSKNWQLSSGEPLQGDSVHLRPGVELAWRFHRPAAVHPAEVPASQWLQPSPLVDDYLSNQGVSTPLHVVEDYFVSLQFQQTLRGILTIECRSRDSIVTLSLSDGKAPRNKKTDSALNPTEQTRSLPVQCGRHAEFAICDGRLLIATDRQELTLTWPALMENGYLAPASSAPASSAPASSSASGRPVAWLLRLSSTAEAMLTGCEIARDLILTDAATATAEMAEYPPGPGYFVLGDNLPVSVDSRHHLGRVQAPQIIGKLRSRKVTR